MSSYDSKRCYSDYDYDSCYFQVHATVCINSSQIDKAFSSKVTSFLDMGWLNSSLRCRNRYQLFHVGSLCTWCMGWVQMNPHAPPGNATAIKFYYITDIITLTHCHFLTVTQLQIATFFMPHAWHRYTHVAIAIIVKLENQTTPFCNIQCIITTMAAQCSVAEGVVWFSTNVAIIMQAHTCHATYAWHVIVTVARIRGSWANKMVAWGAFDTLNFYSSLAHPMITYTYPGNLPI